MDGPERDTFDKTSARLGIVGVTDEYADQAGSPPAPKAPVLRPDLE